MTTEVKVKKLVRCPAIDHCDILTCMHRRPHEPIETGEGENCYNTPSACLNHTGTCKPYPEHTHDTHCTVGADGICIVCGTYHGDPCPVCGGRGFHQDGCGEHKSVLDPRD